MFARRKCNCLLAVALSFLLATLWFYSKPRSVISQYIINLSHVQVTRVRNLNVVITREDEEFTKSLRASDAEPAYEILSDPYVLPPSARIVARKIFKDKPLVVWATEWHMTPIKDLRILLSPFGVKFLDYNLDPWRCEWHDCSAKKKLKAGAILVPIPRNLLL